MQGKERGRERREREESEMVKRKREGRVHTPLPEAFSASSSPRPATMPKAAAEGLTPCKSETGNDKHTDTVSTECHHALECIMLFIHSVNKILSCSVKT